MSRVAAANRHQTEDVITRPWEYGDGRLRLPEGPGLGVEIEGLAVEIDEERLAKLERLNECEDDLVFYGHEDRREPRSMGMW